jgi:hypothetical protein
MPTSVGAAYEVTDDFKANWLFELETSTGVWNPALDAFDGLATDPGAGVDLSCGRYRHVGSESNASARHASVAHQTVFSVGYICATV